MNILITGGSGFIGRNCAEKFLKEGWNVRCLDSAKPLYYGVPRVKWIDGHMEDRSVIDYALDGCDYVLHLAYTVMPKSSNDNPSFDIGSNVLGSLNLLEAARTKAIRKIVFMSSGGTVYGIPHILPIPETHPTEPECSYGISKLTIEKYMALYAKNHGISTCSVRLSNPYGRYQNIQSSQGVISVFCNKLLKNEPIEIWGDGLLKRDFIYIDDVTDALFRIFLTREASGSINIGYGRAISLNKLIQTIENITQKKALIRYKAGRPFDVPTNALDIRKAFNLTGWKPQTSLILGIEKTIEWIRMIS